MLSNPKTTVWGILILLGAVVVLVGHIGPPLLKGDFAAVFAGFQTYWPAVLAALGGAGLVSAKDGGA